MRDTTVSNARVNELAKDFKNPDSIRALMKEFGDSEFPYMGVNGVDGEYVILHIAKDSLILETWQDNGYVRKNFYNEHGYVEGEQFDGKWK